MFTQVEITCRAMQIEIELLVNNYQAVTGDSVYYNK